MTGASLYPLYNNLSCPFEWSKYSCAHQRLPGAELSRQFALEHLEQISYVIVSAVLGATVLTQAQQGRGLPDGPLGLVGLSQYLSYLSLLAALLVLPLTKLGVVGDPQTALLNVPVLTEAVRAPLEALLAALLATIELVVSAILASIQAMGDHGFSSVADAGADMASTINNIYGKTT